MYNVNTNKDVKKRTLFSIIYINLINIILLQEMNSIHYELINKTIQRLNSKFNYN